MTNKIVASKDRELKEVAKIHFNYVENLKKALIVGQMSFLKAGEMLFKIRNEKTYEAEDSDHYWTWFDFLSRPDLPLPGSTPQSQIRTAQSLIALYQLFILKLERPEDELAQIGSSKLGLILKPIKKNEGDVRLKIKTEVEAEEMIDDWLEKAKNLSWRALYAEVKGGGDEEIGEGLQCDHDAEELKWVCPDCGARSAGNDPMNDKHKIVKINYGTPKRN